MHRFPFAWLAATAFVLALINRPLGAAEPLPGPAKQGAALLKTDILGVFAHPDDETGMAATIEHRPLTKAEIGEWLQRIASAPRPSP